MKVATVHSRCECQAHLFAELDEQRVALRGWAVDARKRQLAAPANTIAAPAASSNWTATSVVIDVHE